MVKSSPDPAKMTQSDLLRDGPDKGTVWGQLQDSMELEMGSTHPIVKRMEEVQPDGDRKKLHECLVFWATVLGPHKQTLNPSDSSWDITIDKTAAQSPGLGKAHMHMRNIAKIFNTYISMEVARCMQLKWSIVILGGEEDGGDGHMTNWLNTPIYVRDAYEYQDFDTDKLDVRLWYEISNSWRNPPPYK
jgi:hypothetical protein